MEDKKGLVLLSMVVFLGILTTLTLSLLTGTGANIKHLRMHDSSTAAFWLAEAGIEKALHEIEKTGTDYTGELTELGGGRFRVTVEKTGSDFLYVVSEGIYAKGSREATKKIELAVTVKKLHGERFRVEKGLWKNSRGRLWKQP